MIFQVHKPGLRTMVPVLSSSSALSPLGLIVSLSQADRAAAAAAGRMVSVLCKTVVPGNVSASFQTDPQDYDEKISLSLGHIQKNLYHERL